jgi:phosphoglucomutase/phosphomannomutase
MDLLKQALVGIEMIDAEPEYKDQASKNLRRWLSEAEFAAYAPQIKWLIQTKQFTGLLERFYQILPFGTGGRRGAVGVGPNRMNLWTLGASVQGHCEYLKERFPGTSPLRVVLAYDVRRFEDQRESYNDKLPNPVLHLSSRDFAIHAARVYAANGIEAWILPEGSSHYLATPELSFTIRFLGAHGGLNISASHNPPDDNGGKFYDERGAQPVPPDDQIMADIVDQVSLIKEVPWTEAVRAGRIRFLDDAPHKAYIDLCRKQSSIRPPHAGEIQVVFTPLHGVGSMTALETLEQQGFRVATVADQLKPDGQFPNVTQTPNPEIPASMDRAQALAQEVGADLVLATDPDADRIGAMVPDKAGQTYRFLDGNTIAALLTHFKLASLAEAGHAPRHPIVIKTLVTTGLIARMARHFQAQLVDNLLVGFKYIAEVLWQLEQFGRYEDVEGTTEDFVIGTEESHGILLTAKIRDKDAAGAALLLAEMALDQKRQGNAVVDYLDRIQRRFGYFRNEVHNIIMPGMEGKQKMVRMLNRLRTETPSTIGGLKVTGFDDFQNEEGRLGPFKGSTDKAARNFLHFQLGANARIALRPSGTEPKAKFYVEACSAACPPGASTSEWRATCLGVDELVKKLVEAFSRLCAI